jgi:hypothetical protein
MTHPSRRKGNVFETEVVAALKDHGINVKKVPLSGSLGGEYCHDLVLPDRNERIECKRREKMGLSEFYAWLAKGPDYILYRRSRSDILVTMTFDKFVELLKANGQQ